MPIVLEKDEAHRLIDQLPANATWDNLMHQIYVRKVIDRGLEDSQKGRTGDVREVRTKFSLAE